MAGTAAPAVDLARPRSGRIARAYARWVIRWKWAVVAFWLVVVSSATMFLPAFGSGGDELASIIPLDSPAIRAELRSIQEFGYPLSSRTVVVQRDPAGLSVFTQAESVLDALAVNQHPQPYPLLGALPLTNTLELFPSSQESGTTVLTYLFMVPISGFADQLDSANHYIDTRLTDPRDHTVGVAGSVPARAEQASLVATWLPVLEVLTLAAVLLLVGLTFRALIPPLLAMAASAVAFLLTLRVAGLLGTMLGIAVPAELEPLLVALLLGVVTDYTIFYVSAFRDRLSETPDDQQALRWSISAFTPIVAAAGITVACGTAALLAARSEFFRAFGPAMALSVTVAVVVSVTLIPALMAILGRRMFWPTVPAVPSVPAVPAALTTEVPTPAPPPAGRGWLAAYVSWLIRPRVAAVVLTLTLAGLVLLSLPLLHLNLGVGFTQSLPASNTVRQASAEAAEGFAPGITSPTTLLVEGDKVTGQLPALRRLQRLIEDQPGVAGVFGPDNKLTPRAFGVLLSPSTNAARMLVVMDHDPLGAVAIDDIGALREQLPALVQQSGLTGATVSVAGDTALAEGLVSSVGSDLIRIAIAAIIVNLLLLMVFLRAVIAPLYLLASSILALCAALGLTTFVFQDRLGGEGLTFYVPFATAVLLVSLGSDYNIFGVGHVIERTGALPLREAIKVALPESTRAITAAGLTLAVSFGMLVVIPLTPFRELGFAMVVGILLDAVVVRSILMPCLLTLVGPISGWPGASFRYRVTDAVVASPGRKQPQRQ